MTRVSTPSQVEAVVDGAIYTRNLRHLYKVNLTKPTMVLLFPKAFTPICTRELFELDKHRDEFDVQVIAGSTDSPEAQDHFIGSIGSISYPIITVAPRLPLLWQYVDNDGYCKRITLFIKNGVVAGSYAVKVDEQRDMRMMYALCRELLQ